MSLTKVTYSMIQGSSLNVLDFMTPAQIADVQAGTLSVDVTASIQAAVDYATSTQIVTNTTGSAGRPKATISNIIFPKGKYLISDAITFSGSPTYVNVFSFDNAYISQSNASKSTFIYPDAYINRVQGIYFNGGVSSIRISGTNTDAGRFIISNCDFEKTTSFAINVFDTSPYTGFQSSTVHISDCRVINCAQFLRASSDDTWVNNTWLEVDNTSTMAANTAFIENHAGVLHLDKILGVPAIGDTGSGRPVGVRWIDNYGKIIANECHFGGENAGIPIVYNYVGVAQTSPYNDGGSIIIRNSQIACGPTAQPDSSVIYCATDVPQYITIKDCYGESSVPMVIASAVSPNLISYLATQTSLYPYSRRIFQIEPNMVAPSSYLPVELQPYTIQNTFASTQLNTSQVLGQSITGTYSSGASTVTFDTYIGYNTGVYYSYISGYTPAGYRTGAIYEMYLAIDPNAPSTASYRNILAGLIIVDTGYSGGAIKQEISYVPLANVTGTGNSACTVAVYFYTVGGGTSTTSADGSTNNWIQIVIGSVSNDPGVQYTMRLVKKL
jgi:hypothetical protein